jgi:hypothetical protein
MLEVYNEKIRCVYVCVSLSLSLSLSLSPRDDPSALARRDLLDSRGDDLEVRLGKQGTHVHNLSEWRVRSVGEALELFARGQSSRQVASNNVNEHSSRSHLVIQVKITRTSLRRGGEGLEGHLYLVDLAGSERIKQTSAAGQRLKEAQNINKCVHDLMISNSTCDSSIRVVHVCSLSLSVPSGAVCPHLYSLSHTHA